MEEIHWWLNLIKTLIMPVLIFIGSYIEIGLNILSSIFDLFTKLGLSKFFLSLLFFGTSLTIAIAFKFFEIRKVVPKNISKAFSVLRYLLIFYSISLPFYLAKFKGTANDYINLGWTPLLVLMMINFAGLFSTFLFSNGIEKGYVKMK